MKSSEAVKMNRDWLKMKVE